MSFVSETDFFEIVLSEGFTSSKHWKKYLKYKTIFYNSPFSGNLESRNVFEIGVERDGENKYSLSFGRKGLAWLFQAVIEDLATDQDVDQGVFKHFHDSTKILTYGKIDNIDSQLTNFSTESDKVFGLRLKKEEIVLLNNLSKKLIVLLNFDPKLGISELVEALFIGTLAYGIKEELERNCSACNNPQIACEHTFNADVNPHDCDVMKYSTRKDKRILMERVSKENELLELFENRFAALMKIFLVPKEVADEQLFKIRDIKRITDYLVVRVCGWFEHNRETLYNFDDFFEVIGLEP